MKRIIVHWSAGKYSPSREDLSHYHFLVGSKGEIFKGLYDPEDNLNCNDGKYAAHTGGFNTGSIGIALCAMYGYKNPDNIGNYPFLKVQGEAMWEYCAALLKKYGLKPNKNTVITHYEVGKMFPKSSSAGKIDITFIPCEPKIKTHEAADYIREKVRWYYERQTRIL